MVTLQFIQAGLKQTSLPTTIHCDPNFFELSKIWEKNGITLNKVAPEVIYDLLLKMKNHENSNIEYIRNWILRNHVKYIEKVKEKKIKNVNRLHSEDGKLKVKILNVAKS